jgi:hypothetical protein
MNLVSGLGSLPVSIHYSAVRTRFVVNNADSLAVAVDADGNYANVA